jgi:hypothetical protein
VAILSRIWRDDWAWPRGDHHLLLKAVLAPDDAIAVAAARRWLDAHDIDSVTFRDHRLLAAMAQRFGPAIADHPAYPRLVGVSRQLWARSQLAIGEARAALLELSTAMKPMLMKGASRAAVDPKAAKSRVAADIDLLVHPADMGKALSILFGRGWQASTGASALRLASELPRIRALNLFYGRLGDIDLHQAAYHPLNHSQADEAALWSRSLPARFHGMDMLAPSASDRAALAIAHGSLDAHLHSDWLVDCAVAISDPAFQWRDFVTTVELRHIEVAAAIALGYLAGPIGIDMPGDILDRIRSAAGRRGFERALVLLQAKPRDDLGTAGNLLRGAAKLHRKGKFVEYSPADARPRIRGRKLRSLPSTPMPLGLVMRATLPGTARAGSLRLRIAVPAVARRIEFEINGPGRHVAGLSVRTFARRERLIDVVFKLDLPLDPHEGPFVIEARPTRQLRERADPQETARYGAVPFMLLS